MRKLILQDIDGISFPFKKQFCAYLRGEGLLPEGVIKNYEDSDYIYFHDYFLNNGFDISELGFQEDSELIKWFRKIVKDFGDSSYFVEGYNEELRELNKELKKDGFEIHGLTARCCDKNPDITYNNARKSTELWSERYDIGFETIHYRGTKIKHEILDNVGDVVCMIDDTPSALEGFLKRGVPCVLLRDGHPHKEDYIEFLKEEYGDLLEIVNDLDGIKNAVRKFESRLHGRS